MLKGEEELIFSCVQTTERDMGRVLAADFNPFKAGKLRERKAIRSFETRAPECRADFLPTDTSEKHYANF